MWAKLADERSAARAVESGRDCGYWPWPRVRTDRAARRLTDIITPVCRSIGIDGLGLVNRPASKAVASRGFHRAGESEGRVNPAAGRDLAASRRASLCPGRAGLRSG